MTTYIAFTSYSRRGKSLKCPVSFGRKVHCALNCCLHYIHKHIYIQPSAIVGLQNIYMIDIMSIQFPTLNLP